MNAHERAHDEYTVSNLLETDQEFGTQPNSLAIPLPLDIPPPPNLSQLPAHILHSGTVETLLGQNEDLMARLKVNIRRNSLLEQQIMEQDRQAAELKRAHQSLIAQYQVLQEKDEMLREKSQTFDLQTEELRDQISIMQARVEAAEERSHELRAGLKFETSYRRRIRAWVRPFINGLQAKLEASRARIEFLDRELGTREAVIGDLSERLAKNSSLLQSQQVASNQNQSMLVENYESRLSRAETEAARAKAESSLYRDKANRLEEAVSARAAAENRIITLERANKEIEGQSQSFRQEAKAIAAESQTAREHYEQMKKESTESKAELMRVQDQLESLQAVWTEAQKKLEASKLQQDALNKLNQELSRQLRTERKARETATPAAANAPVPAAPEDSTERLGKIDAILAELESGFSKARGLDFIEDNEPPNATL